MGTTRDDGSQQAMWLATADLPQGGGHPFYERLNEILGAAVLPSSSVGEESLSPNHPDTSKALRASSRICRGIAYLGGHSTKLIWTSGSGCTSRASSKVNGRQSWASCCAVASWVGESLPANVSRNACASRGVLDR